MDNENEGKNKAWGFRLENFSVKLVTSLMILLIIVVVIRKGIIDFHNVLGNSMLPNFHDGDLIVTNKVWSDIVGFKKGDVVLLREPQNPKQAVIKRIIGLPLEKIKIQGGKVYIDGEVLSEPYLLNNPQTLGGEFFGAGEEKLIPKDQYFVMGDNRKESFDSRVWGPISKDLIIGQVWIHSFDIL